MKSPGPLFVTRRAVVSLFEGSSWTRVPDIFSQIEKLGGLAYDNQPTWLNSEQASESSMAPLSIQTTSTSSKPRYTYDAFLSFCGKDTRKGFTDHLHAALKQKGIVVFKDSETLEQGKDISQQLLEAIQKSRFAIVVISEGYVSSKWCLKELTQIVECKKKRPLIVLPIFYHVEPSYVRNKKRSFEVAFARDRATNEANKKQRKRWKAALKEVSLLVGWHIDGRHEATVVNEICGKILGDLGCSLSNISNNFVGIEPQVEKIISLLHLESNDVLFTGIYGMGGIGKTTLARIIYDKVSSQFEASCFVAQVAEKKRKHGLAYLHKQIISQILVEKEVNIWDSYDGIKIIKKRLCNKKVFIVLDNVDEEEELKALAGNHDWFGQGSKIIMTSRDRHLLIKHVDNTYEVEMLNSNYALQLFSMRAFKKNYPKESYIELSKDIVNYAGGLPLALEVFGSFLFGRTVDVWKSACNQLKEDPNVEIVKRLQISFDGLENSQKELFLDIAYFFNGMFVADIIHKLESLHRHPKIDIEVLVDKSLIKISYGEFRMHTLFQKMVQQIAHYRSLKELGKRSRLWYHEEIIQVLKNNIGTDMVESIVLKLPLQKKEYFSFETFSRMRKLRMLEIRCKETFGASNDENFEDLHTLEWYGDPSKFFLSNELCVMEWWGYPLGTLPTTFQPNNLVELIMRGSCIKQLWHGRKSLCKLKHIDLSYSLNLIQTADFSGVSNLEELDLSYCTSLLEVHTSIGFLKRLIRLSLRGCKSLKRLPNMINLPSLIYLDLSRCSMLKKFPNVEGNMATFKILDLKGTAIEKLPSSFQSFLSLEYLNISSCSRFNEIPKSLSSMRHLKYLNVNGTAIRNLPSFVVFLKKLKLLCIGGSYLKPISFFHSDSLSCLSSLESLYLGHCNLSDGILPGNLSCLSSLKLLDLSGNKFTKIPNCAYQLSNLEELYLHNCSNIQALAKPLLVYLRSLRILNLSYCNLLDGAIPDELSCLTSLESLYLSGNKFTRISNTMYQLPKLYELKLDHCRNLQALPKLPLSLGDLVLENCPSLGTLDIQIDTRTSSEMLVTNLWFSVAIYIGYEDKPCKILHLRPHSPIWNINKDLHIHDGIAWGPTQGYEVPGWFNQGSTSAFEMIHNRIDLDLEDDFDLWVGYFLFVTYEVHKTDSLQRKRKRRKVHEHGNSNSGTFVENSVVVPEFVCHLQVNEGGQRYRLDFCAPEVSSTGPNGIWMFITASCLRELQKHSNRWSYLEASIATKTLNMEVKEVGARIVHEHDLSKFYEVVNSISQHGLDSESLENYFSDLGFLNVYGPIKKPIDESY